MKDTRGMKIFRVFNTLLLALVALTCILPFVHVLALSLSNNAAAQAGKVKLWPVNFTLFSYQYVLERDAFWRSLGISLQRIFLGTLLNMGLTILTAYPLSKSKEQVPHRTLFVWFFSLPCCFPAASFRCIS